MKKLTLSFLLLIFLCPRTEAQVETFTWTLHQPPMTAVFNDHVYISYPNWINLQWYNGTTTTTHPFPGPSGCKGLFALSSKVVVVVGSMIRERFLYDFDGLNFIPVVTGEITSGVVQHNGILYFMARTPAGQQLHAYDGTAVTLPIADVFSDDDYKLLSAGRFVYIDGVVGATEEHHLFRFDGTVLRTLPAVVTYDLLDTAWPLGNTENVYFRFGLDIYYCNGTTVVPVLDPEGEILEAFFNPILYHDELYVSVGEEFLRCAGATSTNVTLPSAVVVLPGHHAVFNDELYVSVRRGPDSWHVYRFNGTTFTHMMTFDHEVVFSRLSNRQGKLIIIPETDPVLGASTEAFEYDGSIFTRITTPVGGFISTLQSTYCYHTWAIIDGDGGPGTHYFVAREDKVGVCDEEFDIVPVDAAGFGGIDINLYGHDREWCWTGVEIDWQCLLPPCPVPVETTLTDAQGKIAWKKSFAKPFSETFSVEDLPHSASIAVQKDNVMKQVISLDQNLVSKGIEEISMNIFPSEKYLNLTVKTEKMEKVPFLLSLLDSKGESLWQKEFMAPMSEEVRAVVSKPGHVLRFSASGQAISSVSVYPNPFSGSLTIQTKPQDVPLKVSLSDMNGQVIIQRTIEKPGAYTLEVGNQKPGLYILSLSGKQTIRELVQLAK